MRNVFVWLFNIVKMLMFVGMSSIIIAGCNSGGGSNDPARAAGGDGLGAPEGTKLHDNRVYFVAGSGVTSLGGEYLGYDISTGQPVGGVPTYDYSSGTLTIDFEAGRHKTSQVADSFIQLSGEHVVGDDSFAEKPSELSFYIVNKFIINGSPVVGDIYTGQGVNSLGYVNWWLGGANSSLFSSDHYLLVTTVNGGIYRMYTDGNRNAHFTIEQESSVPIVPVPHNTISFEYGWGVQNVTVVYHNGYVATGNGGYFTSTNNDNSLILDFQAEDNLSTQVANLFVVDALTKIPAPVVFFNPFQNFSTPEQLAFFLNTNLYINGSPVVAYDDNTKIAPFYIGEGFNYTYNHVSWWIGTSGAIYTPNQLMLVMTQDNNYYKIKINVTDDNNYKFEISR